MIEGLSARLKSSRISVKLSRKQVGELIGVSESMIGLYEGGARQPSLVALIKLASIYKVSTDYLLGCEKQSKLSVSLDGLSEQQIQIIQQTVHCFRGQA